MTCWIVLLAGCRDLVRSTHLAFGSDRWVLEGPGSWQMYLFRNADVEPDGRSMSVGNFRIENIELSMQFLCAMFSLCFFVTSTSPTMSTPRPRRPFPLVLMRYRSRSSTTSSVHSEDSTAPSEIAFARRLSDASSFFDDPRRWSLSSSFSSVVSHVSVLRPVEGDGGPRCVFAFYHMFVPLIIPGQIL